ncbi:hypothetical protein DIPPA_16188 [Diplonema papillatum]|nr:hypothetical protein DIPPA_16188 [Diplonema papillatum]
MRQSSDEEYIVRHELWVLIETVGSMLIAERPGRPAEAVKEYLESGRYKDADTKQGAALADDPKTHDYLASHRVGEFLEKMLQYTMLKRPTDPARGMLLYLTELQASDGVFTVEGDDGSVDVQALLLLCRCAAPGRARTVLGPSQDPKLHAPGCGEMAGASLSDMLTFVAQQACPQYYPVNAKRRLGIQRVLSLREEVARSRSYANISATVRGQPSEESSDDTATLQQLLAASFCFDSGFAAGPTVTIADSSMAPLIYFLERGSFPLSDACLDYLTAFFDGVPAAKPSFASIAASIVAGR